MNNKEIKQTYDINFYEEQSPYSLKSAQKIVPYLTKLLPNISNIIDVGCGIGGWLYEWKKEGKSVLGIDGNDLPVERKKIDEKEYLKHDLSKSLPKLDNKFDLCMNLEVAEHLPQERANSFIKELCLYSDIILFSAAIPGQTGVNHINEQWPDYWADIFFANGYKAYDILRDVFWNDDDVAWWYSQNMILYINSNKASPFVNNNEKVLSRVHPKCFLMYAQINNTESIKKRLTLKQKIKNRIKRIVYLLK